MTNGDKRPTRRGVGEFLSITGSLASLIALAFVLLDKVAQSRGVPQQLAVWQITLALLALLAVGATCTFVYDYVSNTIASAVSFRNKVLRSFVTVGIGLILLGVFADGMYAAIYWRFWMRDMVTGGQTLWMWASRSEDHQAEIKGPQGAISRETIGRLRSGETVLPDTEVLGHLAPTGQQVEGFNVDLWSLRGNNCGREFLAPLSTRLARQCTVELRSTDFDPYLIVSGLGFVEDDDSGGGHNAKVTIDVFIPVSTTIVVTSARRGETGSYTLRVRGGS